MKSELRKNTIKLFIDTSDSENIKIKLNLGDIEFKKFGSQGKKAQITLELIDDILNEAGITLMDIDELYVKVGPGSYTGLKVGTAIANTLSFVLQIPVNNLSVGKLAIPVYED